MAAGAWAESELIFGDWTLHFGHWNWTLHIAHWNWLRDPARPRRRPAFPVVVGPVARITKNGVSPRRSFWHGSWGRWEGRRILGLALREPTDSAGSQFSLQEGGLGWPGSGRGEDGCALAASGAGAVWRTGGSWGWLCRGRPVGPAGSRQHSKMPFVLNDAVMLIFECRSMVSIEYC